MTIEDLKATTALRKAEVRQKIIEFLVKQPRAPKTTIARELGLHPSTVHRHLKEIYDAE